MDKNNLLVKAVNKNVRSSPRKIALVLNHIRGKKADIALRDLEFTRKRISKDVSKTIPSLSALAGGIGDMQVRNKGTLGGSIANNDPSACYPSACIALNATIHTSNRKIEASKFFKGMFETALKKDELITAVEFNIPEKSCYIKIPNPASRYAMVGVYIAKYKKEVICAVTGAQPVVYRCKEIEKELNNNFSADALNNVSLKSADMNSDIHASAEYRASLVLTAAQKAVLNCK